jgi:hypothetical protein
VSKNGARRAPSKEWALAMYQTASGEVPSRTFLLECPKSVRLQLLAILIAVRDGPPTSFPASNMWHVMKDDMKGFHEARDEHDGMLYRVFCVLDRHAQDHGLDAPLVVLISGGSKKVQTRMHQAIYVEAKSCRSDYDATRRRQVQASARPPPSGLLAAQGSRSRLSASSMGPGSGPGGMPNLVEASLQGS